MKISKITYVAFNLENLTKIAYASVLQYSLCLHGRMNRQGGGGGGNSPNILSTKLVGWLVVFNVPSTARSFRDGTPIYCPLRRT